MMRSEEIEDNSLLYIILLSFFFPTGIFRKMLTPHLGRLYL